MSLSPAAIGKLYVDLHTAQQDLEREDHRWESYLDWHFPEKSKDEQTRLLNLHRFRVSKITARINACKAQIAAL